jgi:hypothetical protein
MSPQAPLIRPPRMASWLIELFSPKEQAEWITGDLLEEFSYLTSTSGFARARRWYWRQSLKTTAYLIAIRFRFAPWSILGAVLGGFLLLRFGARLPETVMIAVLRTQRPYSTAHYNLYVFWVTEGILIVRLIQSTLIGCIVATVAKRRELVATMTLSLMVVAITGMGWAQSAGFWPDFPVGLAQVLVTTLEYPLMIVAGGAIVKIARSAPARRPSVV